MSDIKEINKHLQNIHKILSGDDEIPNLKTPIYEPLCHYSGIQGKIVKNETINPDLYYKLLDDDK